MENHTVAEVRSKDTDAPEQSKNAVSPLFFFFFLSLALAAFFPIVLLCSGGDMWRLSLLLCSYFHSAVCVLSAATRKGTARLLVRLTYTAFLALFVDAVLNRGAGAVIMYLDSVWTAGVFGHALAEHRAREMATGNPGPSSEYVRKKLARELGSIVFLALVFSSASSPPCMLAAGCSLESVLVLTMAIIFIGPVAVRIVLGKHRDSEKAAAADEDAQGKLAGELGLIIFLALALSACGLCPLCITTKYLWGQSPLEFVLVFLPMVLCSLVPVTIICTLKGTGRIVTFLGVECNTVDVLVWCYVSAFVLFTVSFLLASKGKAVVAVFWICVLGLAVLFGYCLRLLGINRRWLCQPELLRTEEQADADGGNKERNIIIADGTTTACKQANGRN